MKDDTLVSRVHKLKRRWQICNKTGKCSYCPMHGGENIKYKKHGKNKPRYKNKR